MPVLENQRWERFAQGLATGLGNIAAYVAAGFSPKGAAPSANRLLRKANVQARVKELKSAIAEEIVQVAIGARNARLTGYQERHDLLRTLIKERQVDPCNQLAAGAKTGLMCRTVKSIGGGDNSREVEEFAVDVGLLRELRELEKQAAIEVGDWFEHEKAPPIAGPVTTATWNSSALSATAGANCSRGTSRGSVACMAGAQKARVAPNTPSTT